MISVLVGTTISSISGQQFLGLKASIMFDVAHLTAVAFHFPDGQPAISISSIAFTS
jgi:hypothetical protein